MIWDYDAVKAGAIESNTNIDATFTLRGGWRLGPRVEFGFVDFDQDDYAGYEVGQGGTLSPYQPLTRVDDEGSVAFQGTTPTLQLLNANARVARSRVPIFTEGSRGYETRITGGLTLRPTNSIRLTSSAAYSRITRDRDGSEFARTIIPRIKLEYQPFRSLFFRVVTEYVAQRRVDFLTICC